MGAEAEEAAPSGEVTHDEVIDDETAPDASMALASYDSLFPKT